jgi:ribosomal protein S12 methylthiotransferase
MYSAVAGATANQFGCEVPDAVKKLRWEKFMQVQAGISAEKLKAKTGSIIEVLIDAINPDEIIGRSHADAPEIDGTVSVAGKGLKVGQRVKAKITHADTYDLFGEVVS